VFDLQDKITASVVGAIEPTLRKEEIERVRRKPVENIGAYDLYLRALSHIYTFRPDENRIGFELLQRAIALDPNYAPALAFAAWALEQRLTRGWATIGDEHKNTAIQYARRAISAGKDDATVLVVAGFVLVMVARDYDAGLEAVRRAIALNPGAGFVVFLGGAAMIFGGDPEDAIPHLDRAMSLNPLDPGFFMYLTCAGIAHLVSGRAERALELAKQSVSLYPDWDTTYWVLVPANAAVGRIEEARAALAQFLPLAPTISTIAKLRDYLPFKNPANAEVMIEGFRKAGLPE
jgi:adenylate cyclase